MCIGVYVYVICRHVFVNVCGDCMSVIDMYLFCQLTCMPMLCVYKCVYDIVIQLCNGYACACVSCHMQPVTQVHVCQCVVSVWLWIMCLHGTCVM